MPYFKIVLSDLYGTLIEENKEAANSEEVLRYVLKLPEIQNKPIYIQIEEY